MAKKTKQNEQAAHVAPVAKTPEIITPDTPTYKCIGNKAFVFMLLTKNPKGLAAITQMDALDAVAYINKNVANVEQATKSLNLLETSRREKIERSLDIIAGMMVGDEELIQKTVEKAVEVKEAILTEKQKRLEERAKREAELAKEAKENEEKKEEKQKEQIKQSKTSGVISNDEENGNQK